jgi:hypothetical protein
MMVPGGLMTTSRTAIVFGLTLLFARPAAADLTGFIGATTPETRAARGVAIGVGLLMFATEFEYSFTPSDADASAPELKTGSANLLLQTPFAIAGFQPYITGGFGVYTETLGTHSRDGFVPNTGGGVKISLVGPVRLRVDYRVFKFGDSALTSKAHRIYAGLNLRF